MGTDWEEQNQNLQLCNISCWKVNSLTTKKQNEYQEMER